MLALLLLGCGLGDYESHIDKQRKRLEQVDLENKLIGEPLKIDELGLAAEFFLRAPRELAREAEPPLDYPPKKGENQVSLFRFGLPKSERVDGTRPEKVESPLFLSVFVTTAPGPEDKLKEFGEEFRKNVLGALIHYRWTTDVLVQKTLWKKHQTPPLTYTIEFPGGVVKDKGQKETYQWNLSLYFHEQDDPGGARRIYSAIIFQVPYDKKDDERMRKVRDLSLRSFGVGEEYQNKVALYDRWQKK